LADGGFLSEGAEMKLTGTLSERRRALRETSQLSFVQRDEFCKLLLSSKKMIRSDEPRASVRGLLDVETGRRYLIEQENLFGGV
jgi:hypothetical protein